MVEALIWPKPVSLTLCAAVTVMFGFGKYGWLAALSASARNSMFLPSVMRVCLINAMSMLFWRGPRSVEKRNGKVRTWLPSNCLAVAVSKLATLNQCSGVRWSSGSRMSAGSP